MHATAIQSPLYAAYLTGRCCNRLWWHAQQTLLLSDNRTLVRQREFHRSSLGADLRELVKLTGECSVANPASATLKMREAERSLFGRLDHSDRMFELLNGAREEFRLRDHEDDSRAEICQQLVRSEIESIVVPLIDHIADQHSQDHRHFFDLGKIIDEGARRPDVCRFMNDDLVPPRLFARVPPPDEATLIVGTWEPGGESSVSSDYELVRCQIEPGELAPQNLWPEAVKVAWKRAGNDPDLIGSIFDRLSQKSLPQDLLDIVNELDRLVSVSIDKLVALRPPPQFKFGPIHCKKSDVEAALAANKRHQVDRRRWTRETPDGSLWFRDDANGGYLRDFYFLREQDYNAVVAWLKKR